MSQDVLAFDLNRMLDSSLTNEMMEEKQKVVSTI